MIRSFMCRRTADANAPICYYDHCAGHLIELEPLERDSGKLQVRAPALFLRPQQDYTGMGSGRMPTQIGESFVGRNQPALLTLDTRPQIIVVYSTPALRRYRRCIMTPSGHHVGNLPREVLVDFDARTH